MGSDRDVAPHFTAQRAGDFVTEICVVFKAGHESTCLPWIKTVNTCDNVASGI